MKIKGACMLMLLGASLIGCGDGVPAHPDSPSQDAIAAAANLAGTNASAINKLELGKPDREHPSRYPVVADTTDAGKVQRFMAWMGAVAWENAEVSMSRPPDMKIVGTNMDAGVRETFALWLSPDGRTYEIVVEGRGLYGRMSKRDSGSLREWIESSLS
ncbi:hypothetical protein BCM02_10842 [Paenibacillus methanolicus]|uniref:Lipoprotein n=2 Tax=Paenibacillus methanolicus TaxID=582686 RepID=A0A5S5C190_9BACL|nr:hypothetical protein BCM02_10842 [Paenibacillus methanolicus]